MANIINRSKHPVEIKTIPIQVWTLKTEIDEQLASHPDKRDEIEKFYNRQPDVELERIIPKDCFNGSLILADLNMENLLFFCSGKVTEGQLVTVRILSHSPFNITASIKRCLDRSTKSKVIKVIPQNFRVSAATYFFSDDEKSQLRKFLQAVEPKVPSATETLSSTKQEVAADSESSEMDDLGL